MPYDEDVDLAIMRLAWRADAIDKWREDVDKRLGSIEAAIDELVSSRKIEEAVKAGIRGAQRMQLTIGQKLAAFVVGTLVVADSIKGLVS